MVLGSAIAVFYYLRVMVTMFLAQRNLQPRDAQQDWPQRAGGLMLLLVAALTLLLGIYPQPLLSVVGRALL